MRASSASLRGLSFFLAALLPVLAACDDSGGGSDGDGGEGGTWQTTGGAGGNGTTTDTSGAGGSTTTTSTTTSTSTGGDGSVAQLCVDTINQHRASIGLGPLTRWTDAEACSDGEAESDANSGQPHGAFGSCGESGQNECPGWPGPAEEMIGGCLQMMWDEGPGEDFQTHGHYINMTNPSYSMVSCGFHTLPDGDVWAVQNFK